MLCIFNFQITLLRKYVNLKEECDIIPSDIVLYYNEVNFWENHMVFDTQNACLK